MQNIPSIDLFDFLSEVRSKKEKSIYEFNARAYLNKRLVELGLKKIIKL